MKKFFTIVPLQQPDKLVPYLYQAEGNYRLQMNRETRFPILTAVNGYAEQGEEIRLIAVLTDNEQAHSNLERLREEFVQICEEKKLICSRGVETVTVPMGEDVGTHVSTFQKLLDFVDDEDDLFACTTYGTKPQSTAMMMAVQYAYRIKDNTTMTCVVYGMIDRSQEKWTGHVYDMTALTQMDEIVRVLAERGVKEPEKVIRSILAL